MSKLRQFKNWAKEQTDDAGDGIRAAGRAIDKAVFQPIVRAVAPKEISKAVNNAPKSFGGFLPRHMRRWKPPRLMKKASAEIRSAGRAIDKAVTQPIAKQVKHIVQPVAGEIAMRAKNLANSKAVKQAGDAIGDGLRSFDKNVIQPVSTSKTMKTIQGKAQQAADYVGDEIRNIPDSLKNMTQTTQDAGQGGFYLTQDAQDPQKQEKKGFFPLPYFTKHLPNAVGDVLGGTWRTLKGLGKLDGDEALSGLNRIGSGILGAGEHTIKGSILPVWNAISKSTDGSSSVEEYDDENDDTVVTVGDKEDVKTGTVDDIEPGTVASGGAQTAARSREYPDTDDVMPEGPDDGSGRNTIGVPTEPVKRTGPTDASQSSGGMTAFTGATPEQLYADFYSEFKDVASPLDMISYKIAVDSGDLQKAQKIINKVRSRA